MTDDRPSLAPHCYRIETAPRLRGLALLLWVDDGAGWRFGGWDGTAWADADCFVIEPVAWSPIPAPPQNR